MSAPTTGGTSSYDITTREKNKNKKRKKGGCYHCGSLDHRGRECPACVCQRCNQKGHDAGSCPQRPAPQVDIGCFGGRKNRNDGGIFTRNQKFTYVELFAGIGGFRIALDKLGGQCIFASEINKFACRNYETNFKGDRPAGDITKISNQDIPSNFDLLVGGFPCQPFSSSSSSGRQGIQDEQGRGILFLDIARILQEKQPKMFLLENVRGLLTHENGTTLDIIVNKLKQCGYHVHHSLVNAVDILPQERNRLYIVGILFSKTTSCLQSQQQDYNNSSSYKFPTLPKLHRGVRDILQYHHQLHHQAGGRGDDDDELLQTLCLSDHQLTKVQSQPYTQKFPEARFLQNIESPSKTLQSSYASYMVGSQFVEFRKCKQMVQSTTSYNNDKDNNANDDDGTTISRTHTEEIKMKDNKNKNKNKNGINEKEKRQDSNLVTNNITAVCSSSSRWRKFSSREAARLQGFPESFVLCKDRPYHLLGNAVAPPVIAMIAAPLLVCCMGIDVMPDEFRNTSNKSSTHVSKDCSTSNGEPHPRPSDLDVMAWRWGWSVCKNLLLDASPNDQRRIDLEALLEKQSM